MKQLHELLDADPGQILNVPANCQCRQYDREMCLDRVPLAMVDRPSLQVRFRHPKSGFHLEKLVVIIDHLLIWNVQVGDISFDTCKCSCFVDQFLVELFAPGCHTQKFHFFDRYLPTEHFSSLGDLLFNVAQVQNCYQMGGISRPGIQ